MMGINSKPLLEKKDKESGGYEYRTVWRSLMLPLLSSFLGAAIVLCFIQYGSVVFFGAPVPAVVSDPEHPTCEETRSQNPVDIGSESPQPFSPSAQLKGTIAELAKKVANLTSLMEAAPGSRSTAPGAPWTEDEVLIVMAKIHAMISHQQELRKFFKLEDTFECYASAPDSTGHDFKIVPCDHYESFSGFQGRGVAPTYPMLLRLGFHGCFRREDGTGGCNGCMNFRRMFVRWGLRNQAVFHGGKNPDTRPEDAGHSNGNMAMLGDFLELIYADKEFPPYAPAMEKSLKEGCKSRADLWALASIVGAMWGMENANKACATGNSLYSVMEVPFPCQMKYKPFTFSTGRSDCAGAEIPEPWKCDESCEPEGDELEEELGKGKKGAKGAGKKGGGRGYDDGTGDQIRIGKGRGTEDLGIREECKGCVWNLPPKDGSHRPRAYETTIAERSPNPNFNGKMVADYFAEDFKFTKMETIAILGAHSLGEFHGEVSGGFRYEWTHKQGDQLNNVYYRLLAALPGKHFERNSCMGTTLEHAMATGSVSNAFARTGWKMDRPNNNVGGGHFQYFHQYERCPTCKDGVLVDRHKDTYQGSRCCELCAKATSATRINSPTGLEKAWEYAIEGLTDAEKVEFTKLMCLRNSSVHETAISSDMGLMWQFEIGPGGKPVGCAGLPDEYLASNWIECPKNGLMDDASGLKMHEIVELYANDQNRWANDFVTAVEKMLSNGASEGGLIPAMKLDGIECTQGLDDEALAQALGGKKPQNPFGANKLKERMFTCRKR